MRRTLLWLVPLLIVATPVGLFIVQNEHQTANLGLNLGVWAGITPAPVPVAAVVVCTGLVGLLLGLVVGMVRSSATRRKIRQLEAELTLQAVQGRD